MTKVPIVATIFVGLAVAAMVGLGIWQLDRKQEKEAALALYAANIGKSPVAFPGLGGAHDDILFRQSSVMCVRPIAWHRQSGRSASGAKGWRVIAECATGAEGPSVPIQVGIAPASDARINWNGGEVSGFITHAPDSRPLIAGLFDHTPKRLMLVAAVPLAGLAPNPGPDLSAVPNNHFAYAVQWFLFAGIALVIYALALRKRIAASRHDS